MARLRLRRIPASTAFVKLSACALVACNAIAGIGVPVLETSDDGGTLGDGGGVPVADASGSQPGVDTGIPGTPDANGGGDDGGGPAVDANLPDANMPDTFTPPPPAGKPGFDLTAGGTYGKSAKFRLIATVGESPGGSNVGKSPKYVLKGGVIAVTQPN